MSGKVKPEDLTDDMIRSLRLALTIEISKLSSLRYACVVALGGDALDEGSMPRDASVHQRICDAINARAARSG